MIDILRYGNTVDLIFYFISSAIVVFLSLPVHEMAHAFTAYKLGDNSQKYAGRLTLNPFAHLDPIGSLLILLFGFGWAKPVQVNSFNFKKPKRDMAVTAFAGPVSNIILAFLFYIIYKIAAPFLLDSKIIEYLLLICRYVVQINISLAVFNLIPIPPLDGSKLLFAFLSDRNYYKLMQYERYFYGLLILLLFVGALDTPLYFLRNLILRLFELLTFWI